MDSFKLARHSTLAIAIGVITGTLSHQALAQTTTIAKTKVSTAALLLPAVQAAEEWVADKKVKIINGDSYTFTKYATAKGDVRVEILDPKGQPISARLVPKAEVQIVSPQILEWVKKALSQGDTESLLSVDIALDLLVQSDAPIEVGAGEVREGLYVNGAINGKELNEKEMDAYSERVALSLRSLQSKDNQTRANRLAEWAGKYGLTKAKGFSASFAKAGEGLTLALNSEQLSRLIESKDPLIVGMEITSEARDDINSAMNDTNITNWALPFSNTRGDGIGIYMTESGCADESRITNYDRLSGSETNHSRNVGAIIRAVSPNSFLYCRGGAVLPNNSDLDGVGGNDPIYIMTRSNGGDITANYTTLDRDWDNFAYSNNLAVYKSAGNEGGASGNISSPGKGLNLTSVGNYNDANDTISGGSSFVDPNTGNDKPEISAPGTNITAGGFTMSGTSMSCPHAAAFNADMMSSSTYLKYRPYLSKAKMLAGATDNIAGGYDKVGLGGIDFLTAQYSGYWSWWSGGNGSWSYFDNLDSSSDGYVTRQVYISSGWNNVRVALAWMNRGTYTYDHRNDAHPIGMDLDLRVYDPNGNFVGGSYSWDNPFEDVDFDPTVSGYYTFKINRYANRDSSSAVRIGMYVNYY